MLWILVQKDLLRAFKRPGPYLTMMLLPIAITWVMGMVFAPSSDNPEESQNMLPKIKIAYVNEDENLIGGFMGISLRQGELKEMLGVEDMPYEEAYRLVNQGELSALIRIPTGFTEAFLIGKDLPQIDLVKNPSERYLPVIVEDMLAVFTEGMNAVVLNMDDLSDLMLLLDENGAVRPEIAGKVAQTLGFVATGDIEVHAEGDVTGLRALISVVDGQTEQARDHSKKVSTFSQLFCGLASFFLLFMGSITASDLQAEIRDFTLQRFRTFSMNLFPVVLSKGIFSFLVIFIAALILFIGGGIVFQINWSQPIALLVVLLAYSVFCAGLMNALNSLFNDPQASESASAPIIMTLGFLGGGMVPSSSLPDAITNYITPLMPTYWFSSTIVGILGDTGSWLGISLTMVALGLVFLLFSTYRMNQNLAKGGFS